MKTQIFYKHRTPLYVQVNAKDVEFFAGSGMETLKIHPGPNEIDQGLWEHIKAIPSVQKRVDHGQIVESKPNRSLLMALRGPVNRSTIGLLCAKAREVPDGEVFGPNKATSREGQIREIEDQLAELKKNMPTVGA